MKFTLAWVGFLTLVSSMAWASGADWNQKALGAIDSICADTWCSGDFNYRFDSLKCDFERATCVLRYRSGEWPAEGAVMRFSRSGRCQLKGIRSPSDLIEDAVWVRLKDAPYEKITNCLP